jgi:cellobiose-specific phosphotransferase system component IIA
MYVMANLTLVYGLRLLPEGEIAQTPGAIEDATLKLANGHEAHVTMHLLEGSREQIEAQLRMSIDAFFDFYPEI